MAAHSKPSPWMGEGGEGVVHPVTAEIEDEEASRPPAHTRALALCG
jgi:hypothetical protein